DGESAIAGRHPGAERMRIDQSVQDGEVRLLVVLGDIQGGLPCGAGVRRGYAVWRTPVRTACRNRLRAAFSATECSRHPAFLGAATMLNAARAIPVSHGFRLGWHRGSTVESRRAKGELRPIAQPQRRTIMRYSSVYLFMLAALAAPLFAVAHGGGGGGGGGGH